jgi:diguanylate cyclase (GGDEF)-like protein
VNAVAYPYHSPSPASRLPQSLPSFVALALLSAASSWFSIRMTRFDGGVAALWLSNGLLTGLLLLAPRANWPGLFVAALLGQLLARVSHGSSWLLSLGVVAINLMESGMVAFWVRRRIPSLGQGRSISRMAHDAVFATLIACLLSASLAAALLQSYVHTPLGVSWVSWFTAHFMGMAVVATLTVCALQPKVGVIGRPGMRVDFALCLGLLCLVCAGVFVLESIPLLFLTFLPLQLLVWRHGMSGMMAGIVVLAVASGIPAASGSGPFRGVGGDSSLEHVLFWQAYVAAACALAYSTSVAIARRRELERQLQRSEALHRQMAEEADRLARYDALTGLANRRQFDEALEAAVARSARNGTPVELLVCDLDNFKRINDTLGHAAGDAVLAEFASRLSDCVFDVDLVARMGGDEFVVLVEYAASCESGELIARRVLEAMREPVRVDGKLLEVGVSVGVGLHAPARSATQVFRLADDALYDAKARGRGTWAIRRD